jgi:hypothetical protein
VSLSAVVLGSLGGSSLADASTHGVGVARQAPKLFIGNTGCGHLSISPDKRVAGGTPVTISVYWKGSPSSTTCPVLDSDCTFSDGGDCDAGYWLVGVFCSTLAAADPSSAESDCDLDNAIVLTDYNVGPNDPAANHGTSYNQCSTLNQLAGFFGTLPGTLYCVADGAGGDGWTEDWALRSHKGTATGPLPETGSSTPFDPPAAGVDCPPSAANIQAGAFPNTCAFVVLAISFQYYCYSYFGPCIPNTSDPDDGISVNPHDFMAATFTYPPAARRR